MAMSNFPKGFQYGLTVRNQPILNTHSGNIFWVGKTPEGQAGSNGYDGTYNWPFATIDFAIGKCTANHGDIIIVKAGHTETVSAASDITCDVAGVSIVGLGSGADRPTITFGTANGACVTISAASVTIENIIGIGNKDGLTNPFNITASDCWLDIEWHDTSSTVEAVRVVLATTVSRLFVKIKYLGFVAGDAAVNVVRLVEVTGARIIVDAYGKISTGIVEMVTTASTDVLVTGYFYNESAALTKNVVNTGGLAATWYAYGYDGKGGYSFSGGSAAALAADDISTVISDLAVPAQNSVDNVNERDVIGNKTDTNAGNSIFSKLLVQTADAATNVSVRDVVGNKTDAAVLAKAADKSLVAYIKGLLDLVGTVANTGGTATLGALIGDLANVSVLTRFTNLQTQSTMRKRIASVDLVAANLTGTTTRFTISGGPIRLLTLGLLVTTNIPAGANTLQFSFTPTGGGATDLSGATDTASANAPQLFMLDGVKATGPVKTTDVGILAGGQALHMAQSGLILSTGVIQTIFSAGPPATGAATIFMEWEPLTASSAVA